MEVPSDWPGAAQGEFVDWEGEEVKVPEELPAGAQAMLEENGFVVLGDVEAAGLKDAYFATMRGNFITSDAVLYVFHCLFRGGLSIYEKRELVPLAEEVTRLGLEAARDQVAQYEPDSQWTPAVERNVVFFAVAHALATGEKPDPGIGGSSGKALLAECEEYVSRAQAAESGEFYPGEDYTSYLPRGVYAEDEKLARYFRAMKWLSRRIMPIVPGGMDRDPEAREKLRQAYLLGEMLRDEELGSAWQRLYDEIGFFIARPDSFTPTEFYDVASKLSGAPSDAWVTEVRGEFAKDLHPASKIVPVLQQNPGDASRKYVQFMGERYIPDAQIHGEAVFPHVSSRVLPTGLDIGYALFGSDRAKTHLSAEFSRHPGLESALDRLHGEFGTYASEDDPTSIYSGWIGAVREVLNPPESEHVPEFFHTDPWRDKSLTTALASWTYMRHDFVLYAKHPMTPMCGSQTFLVEPVPGAYQRLGTLSERLAEKGFPGMADFRELCKALEVVARCELAGADWHNKPDFPWDGDFYLNAFGQWLLEHFSGHVPVEQPAVVVDVHTDSGSLSVLHGATGPFNLIVAQNEDYPQIPHQGWVLSYFEFTEQELTRLTDAEWRERVERGKHHDARPEWVESYMVQ